MAKYQRVRLSASNIAWVFLPDSASTVGAGKTGLTNASAGLDISVRRELSSAVTSYTGANIGTIATLGTWVDPGAGKVNFKEVDATHWPGMYELHFVDLLFNASDASRMLGGFVQATGIAPAPFEVELTALNVQDGVRAGLTALPNAAANAVGGLGILDANSLLDVDAKRLGGTTQTGRDVGASVLLSSGVGAGQVSLAAGLVTVGTNNDKTGYGLSVAAVQAVWDALTSALTTVGSIGKRISDNLDATISSRQPSGAVALTAAAVQAVWDALTSVLTTAGSVGKRIADNLDATVSSRQPSGAVALTAGERTTLSAAILDTDLATHLTPGTVGRALQIARAQGRGKWTIAGDILTLFDVDNTTVVAALTLTPPGGPYTGRSGTAEAI